ncbi:putative catechol O-methyltransferase [Skeletonema marinoi]|uniref:Catechol O-methyltransferase n=1 Tax=Skeletonema marinoi TaxID=267567 RepID=A0AAD8XV52_9STRA|nr:putative catechol O-methyltransferase [Skeletonema marinoi]
MILDNSSPADIVIVMPKPDAVILSRDEFSYSNLYSFDYDGVAGSATGATSTSVESTPSMQGNSSDDKSVSLKRTGRFFVSCALCGCFVTFSHIILLLHATRNIKASADNVSSSAVPATPSTFESAFKELAKQNSFNDLAAASATVGTSSSSANHRNSIGGYKAMEASSSNNKQPNTDKITRDPRNGAFTFQVHAEYDLLLQIQKDLDAKRPSKSSRSSLNSLALSDIDSTRIILKSVDDYCYGKQWMYHIGSEKGKAISRFLRSGVERWLKRDDRKNKVCKFICLDCGTYCGYSSLVLASTLREIANELQNSIMEDQTEETFEFHVYTTEVSSKLINVAQSVFRMAKMEQYITPILMKSDGKESLSATMKQNGVMGIDFLLFDHAKNLYLSDLNDLEAAGLLKAGSYVSADNVVFNKLDAYRYHMEQLQAKGIVETRLDEMNLEYSNNLKDGIEQTIYLKDP